MFNKFGNLFVLQVFLTGKCNFQLGGKIFKFLTDVFLFYDFSVNGFVQGVKVSFYAMHILFLFLK